MISETAILQIPISDPARLFSRNHEERKSQYHELVKQWHPDMVGGSTEVFHHIQKLYEAAEAGNWDNSHSLTITSRKGTREYIIKYKIKHPFELGDIYIGKGTVIWFVKKGHEDLVLNGIKAINSIKYPDSKLKEQHERFIPKIKYTVETVDGYYIVMTKTEDVILLDDLIKHLGRIPPKHMAWIVSSLLNILCFYQVTGITHNGLTVGTVFVTPPYHAVFPLGGWWYSVKTGAALNYLPSTVHKITPHDVISRKQADLRIDLASVKLIARTCIGDPTGARLPSTSDVPKPLANWLRLPPLHSAIDEYQNWGKVLTDSWGSRRFLKLDIDFSAIYEGT